MSVHNWINIFCIRGNLIGIHDADEPYYWENSWEILLFHKKMTNFSKQLTIMRCFRAVIIQCMVLWCFLFKFTLYCTFIILHRQKHDKCYHKFKESYIWVMGTHLTFPFSILFFFWWRNEMMSKRSFPCRFFREIWEIIMVIHLLYKC